MNGKVVVVTGASGALGKVVAEVGAGARRAGGRHRSRAVADPGDARSD